MTTAAIPRLQYEKSLTIHRGPARPFLRATIAALALVVLGTAGCHGTKVAPSVDVARLQAEPGKAAEVQTVREGDVLRISFPGAPNLDTTQQVRRDGRITLTIIGEFKVTGLTPADLEQELVKAYAPEIISKEISVTVVSSAFTVFVTGAVIHPGKIISDRPLTALEAIMEAGGFDSTKADMKAIVVIRNEDGGTKNYSLNLKRVLEGKQSEPFYLKPSDIVYVPARFSWF